METGQVILNVINNADQVPDLGSAVFFVEGITKRGKVNNPEDIITSWPQFKKLYGDLDIADNFPLTCYRMIADRGLRLRVNRVTDGSEILSVMNKVEVLTFGDELVTANDIDGDVNSVAITTVTFATDHDTTIGLLLTELEASASISKAIAADVGGVGYYNTVYVYPAATTELVLASFAVTSGATQPSITNTQKTGIIDTSGNPLFNLIPIAEGADYNNIKVTIATASNGDANYFNMTIAHTVESWSEVYENLFIEDNSDGILPTAGNADFLEAIKNSNLLEASYMDISSLTPNSDGFIVPGVGDYYFNTGSDGGTPDVADYVGVDGSGNGFYAFDDYDDSYALAVPAVSESDLAGLGAGGFAYAANRKDLRFYHHLDVTNTTTTLLIAEKESIAGYNTRYIGYFSGGIKLTHPTTGLQVIIPEIADVLGCIGYTIDNFAPWYSFSGPNRGVIPGSLGVVTNFGSPAKFDDLNLLAQRQINMVVQRNGQVMLWDSYSGQSKDNPESFLSVGNLLIYMQKSLAPYLETFLDEPLDLQLMQQIFYGAKPFMEDLKTKRAIFNYAWNGDQNAASLDDLTINTKEDVALGKYVIQLELEVIAPLKKLTLNIVLTREAGVSIS